MQHKESDFLIREKNLLIKLGEFYMALQDNLYFVYVLYTSSPNDLIADTCSETSACQASTNDIYLFSWWMSTGPHTKASSYKPSISMNTIHPHQSNHGETPSDMAENSIGSRWIKITLAKDKQNEPYKFPSSNRRRYGTLSHDAIRYVSWLVFGIAQNRMLSNWYNLPSSFYNKLVLLLNRKT